MSDVGPELEQASEQVSQQKSEQPPRMVLDACVLYPTVMREALIACAGLGYFQPVWSERILEEWLRAAQKLGESAFGVAQADVSMLNYAFPNALQALGRTYNDDMWLPDVNDIHVLRCAHRSGAQAIITRNAKDFPQRILSQYGVTRRDPDDVIFQLLHTRPEELVPALTSIVETAQRMSGEAWPQGRLFKKANLNRVAKFFKNKSL